MKKTKSKFNARGQMAIFVALIFQVLFVFFAMAINVGLVVHDKINLQNATDLAAYYVAQRQAEMLNVIAHTNYQIRQAWKLMNFRYYVWGSLGLDSHPSKPGSAAMVGEFLYPELNPTQQKYPVVCVAYKPPWQNIINDNLCKSKKFFIPKIKSPIDLIPMFGFNRIFQDAVKSANAQLSQNCSEYGAYNWWFAANAYVSYMLDQWGRKEIIRALARNLAKPMNEMVDLSGESVLEGARKTFLKNLTEKNRASVQEFQIINPLQGVRPEQIFPEIDIWYTMAFQDYNPGSGACATIDPLQIDNFPNNRTFLNNRFGEQTVQGMMNLIQQSMAIQIGNSMRLSLGVEKNPWYMVYAGVKAVTAPRQLFPPFGGNSPFVAKAYAMPFGGKVGPWYGKIWARGANGSSGEKTGLYPERLLAGGIMNSGNLANMIPNVSRYVGDTLGYTSMLAQVSVNNMRGGLVLGNFGEYGDILSSFGPGRANDLLPWNEAIPSSIRDVEIAAIAPDLFDLAYYSIEPNFGQIYLPLLRQNRAALGIPDGDMTWPRGDLGSHDRSAPASSEFSVKDQMARARSALGQNINLQNLNAFWFVRDREHLLTDWVHNELFGEYFDFPEQRFGNCDTFDDVSQVKIPGGCIGQGGRTGYSVKIVAREYLKSDELPLGGVGQAGSILNPPPDDW